MKNAIYFLLKARFVLETSKFMTSQTRKQIITIHTLPNISRIKDNQTMKFGQLTESRRFCMKRNNNKVVSIKTGPIVIAYLLPGSDLEKHMYGTLCELMMIKFYRHYLIYKYNFTCSLF